MKGVDYHFKQLEYFRKMNKVTYYTGMGEVGKTDPISNEVYRKALRMNGYVKNLINDRFFGFIRGENGMEYFFHKDDFSGHWLDLHQDFSTGTQIPVQFEVARSPKGPRACDVKRLDFPNQ